MFIRGGWDAKRDRRSVSHSSLLSPSTAEMFQPQSEISDDGIRGTTRSTDSEQMWEGATTKQRTITKESWGSKKSMAGQVVDTIGLPLTYTEVGLKEVCGAILPSSTPDGMGLAVILLLPTSVSHSAEVVQR